MQYFRGRWIKLLIGILIILIISGCTSKPSQIENFTVLEVKPQIDYYSLGGYTKMADEAFYILAGNFTLAKKTLNEIVINHVPAKNTFTKDEKLNLVVFRGTFNTGGHGITIDKVERIGSAFSVHATYTDPGRGMMVTEAFTQPVAIIPIGKLSKGSYMAELKVTSIVKSDNGDKIIEQDKEHERIEFVVK